MASSTWPERILRVADHIQAHLDDELEPVALAELAGFSLHHFHRVFRGMTGESVMGFIRRLRLERAASALRYEDRSVTELAFVSGYNSHEAFTRAFRSRFGVPPQEYRTRQRVVVDPVEFVIREDRSRVCYALRHVGPYETAHKAWQRLYAWAGSRGVLDREIGGFGLVYDDPEVTEAERLRYDACIEIPEADADPSLLGPEITIRRIPAGRYAVALHLGSYDDIGDTYVGMLGRRMPAHGLELATEPTVELYLNSPMDTAPDDLRTEICMRIDT